MPAKNNVLWKKSDSIMAIIASLLIAGLVFAVTNSFRVGRQSRNWPETQGIITESHITEKFVPSREGDILVRKHNIRYRYKVNGIEYEGNNVSSEPDDFPESLLKKYPTGKEVPVFYDPDKPGIAVLETGVKWENYYKLFFLGCFIVSLLLIPPSVRIYEIYQVISLQKSINRKKEKRIKNSIVR